MFLTSPEHYKYVLLIAGEISWIFFFPPLFQIKSSYNFSALMPFFQRMPDLGAISITVPFGSKNIYLGGNGTRKYFFNFNGLKV